jgi:hypothetical protein
MVLAPSDFAPEARITKQGYVTDKSLVIDYERNFARSTTAGGAKFTGVFSEVDLAHDANEATLIFTVITDVVRSPSFRQQLARQVSQSAGKRAHVRRRDVRFGPVRSLGVGDESILLPVSIRVHGVRFSADAMFLRVDRVLASLTLVGVPRRTIGPGEATGLAGKMAERMRTGLSPLSTVAPGITGTAAQGQPLTATSGTWSNGPTSFAYQWERCDAIGANCAPVAGASGQTYTLTAADAATTIRVSVTATNAVGSSNAATSTPTVVIQ